MKNLGDCEKIDGSVLILLRTFIMPVFVNEHWFYKEARMSKRGRKRKDRRKNGANHGKRPNS